MFFLHNDYEQVFIMNMKRIMRERNIKMLISREEIDETRELESMWDRSSD